MTALTHPGKLLWPAEGLTKQDLADYLRAVAEPLLAQVAGRPLTVLRAPGGITGKRFFQRHPMPGLPAAVQRIALPGEPKPLLLVDSLEGLLGLAQFSVLELHPWGCRAEDPDRPDRLVFDLDPAPGVAWPRVVAAAHALREALAATGLHGFCKTTGGKGLHVVVPLVPRAPWAVAHRVAHDLCAGLEAAAPAEFTLATKRAARTGRILLDYLRNDRGATAVAAWSPRARPGAPVAMPLSWSEVTPALDPAAFTLRTAPSRLSGPDPWPGFAAAARPLPG